MIKTILIVGTGSFAGGVSRYLSSVLIQKYAQSVYPYGTIFVNIVGCLLIGILYALAEKGNIMTPEWRIFLTTGFCAGFTTFSTFSLDALNLMNDRGVFMALLYIGASIFIGLLFTYGGIILTKSVLS